MNFSDMPNMPGGLFGIHIVIDSYDYLGRPHRQVVRVDDAEVWTDYDIDFNRYRVRVEGKIPRDDLLDEFPSTVPSHPAEENKEITDGEEVILAELIEE